MYIDPDLMVDLYVGDGTDYYCLTLDNVYPSPQPLQLWTSLNSWASAIANPPSLFMDTDDANSLVLGIDLADINLDGYTELEAQAAANLYGASGYDDYAPDAGYVTFSHVAGPSMETQTILVDDTAGGDGDHVAEGGELARLEVLLINEGDTPTGANLTAVFTRDAGSTASFSVLGGTVTYGGGTPIGIGATAVPDSDVRVDLDAGAVAGDTVVLQADLTDDDGNAWTIETLPLLVGVEAADIASGAPLVSSSSILTGDTDLLNNDYDQPLACTGYSAIGDEGVYRLQLTSGQELTAYLMYETYPPDATLYISDDPTYPDVNCLAGVDDVILDSYETLEFTAPTTGTYLLVVDSFGYSGGGPYSLTVRF